MAIQPFGVKVREKKEVPKKKRKWLTVSTFINIILLIITLISVSTASYFGLVNQQQQNTLYNYTPFIFSNYSSPSNVQSFYYSPDETYMSFQGLVSVDLKIVTPYDGKLTITPISFGFSDQYFHFSGSSTYFNMSLQDYNSVIFYPVVSADNYQYFISKNVMNPIQDKVWVQVNTYVNSGVFSDIFKGEGENRTKTIDFPLGIITFQAALFEAQIGQYYYQNFTEGVYCRIINYT